MCVGGNAKLRRLKNESSGIRSSLRSYRVSRSFDCTSCSFCEGSSHFGILIQSVSVCSSLRPRMECSLGMEMGSLHVVEALAYNYSVEVYHGCKEYQI